MNIFIGSKGDYGKLKESIDMLAAATAGGADKTALANLFNAVIETVVLDAGIGFISPAEIVGGVVESLWLRKLLQEKGQKENTKVIGS